MPFRYLLIFISPFLLLQTLSAQTQDGLLKNGRSVSYYLQKGQLLRELEPEENEFVQIGIAKVLNCFAKVEIDGFTRIHRYSPEAEDVYRNKLEDQKSLPFHLQGTLSYTNAENLMIHIQLNVNPVEIKATSIRQISKNQHDNGLNYWKIENYSTTTSSGKKYQGEAIFFFVGNTLNNTTSKKVSFQGIFKDKKFSQINHIVVRILAPETQAIQIIKTMNMTKLMDTLNYSENWP